VTHNAYVTRTATGWYIWVCTCGDQAPNAFWWKIAAARNRNYHVRTKEAKL
jgi:hypothetical protein